LILKFFVCDADLSQNARSFAPNNGAQDDKMETEWQDAEIDEP